MDRNVKGLLGEKLGMTQVWDEANKVIPVTVIKVAPNVVTKVRTKEQDGYSAVQLAFGEIDPRKVNKPEKGHFAKAGVTPRKHMVEIRTLDANNYTLGQELNVDVFAAGEAVDVTGTSKGKGFAGGIKKWGFSKQGETRGAKDKVRAPGSIGAQTPGRVFPGKKMAGRLGNYRVTIKGLKIVSIDSKSKQIMVSGAVPGARNSALTITVL